MRILNHVLEVISTLRVGVGLGWPVLLVLGLVLGLVEQVRIRVTSWTSVGLDWTLVLGLHQICLL